MDLKQSGNIYLRILMSVVFVYIHVIGKTEYEIVKVKSKAIPVTGCGGL
jgi:hypothetical protein